jgi:hypothetical protein
MGPDPEALGGLLLVAAGALGIAHGPAELAHLGVGAALEAGHLAAGLLHPTDQHLDLPLDAVDLLLLELDDVDGLVELGLVLLEGLCEAGLVAICSRVLFTFSKSFSTFLICLRTRAMPSLSMTSWVSAGTSSSSSSTPLPPFAHWTTSPRETRPSPSLTPSAMISWMAVCELRMTRRISRSASSMRLAISTSPSRVRSGTEAMRCR